MSLEYEPDSEPPSWHETLALQPLNPQHQLKIIDSAPRTLRTEPYYTIYSKHPNPNPQIRKQVEVIDQACVQMDEIFVSLQTLDLSGGKAETDMRFTEAAERDDQEDMQVRTFSLLRSSLELSDTKSL